MAPFLFLMLCVAVATAQLTLFSYVISSRNIFLSAALCGSECLLIFLPLIFLPGKLRPLALIPSLLISIWAVANSIYARLFYDYIPLNLYFKSASYNGLMFSSAVNSLGLLQAVMIIFMMLPIAGYIIWHRKISSGTYPKWLKISFCSATAVCLAASILWRVNYCYHRISPETIGTYFTSTHYFRVGEFNRKGFLTATVQDLMRLPIFANSLSKEEQDGVDTYTARKSRQLKALAAAHPSPLPDGVENVVFIIVESLTSETLLPEYQGFRPMTYLDSLSRCGNVATFRNVSIQAAGGRSSDGQLIYLSGLLPLRSEPWSINYASEPVPSLVKAFRLNTSEIIGESPEVWNHDATSRCYGFPKTVNNAAANSTGWRKVETADLFIFERALGQVDTLSRLGKPFFVETATLGMHDPYPEGDPLSTPPGCEAADSHPFHDRDYLLKCHYFDVALRNFIEKLRQRGLYENTLIVIASDHDPYRSALDRLTSNRGVIMLINSGYNGICDREVRQLDLYPTLLRLMRKESYPWPGLGTDLFHPQTDTPSPKVFFAEKDTLCSRTPESLWRLSDRLLRSRALLPGH